MAAGTYNISIEQGTTYQLDIVWKDSLATPIDVTGYTSRMQMRTTKADSNVLCELTTENGRIVMGTTDGKNTLNLRSEVTAGFSFVSALYDLEVISPAATPVVTRLLQGTITVDPEVTR